MSCCKQLTGWVKHDWIAFCLLTGCMMSGASAVRGGSGSAALTVFRPCCLSWPSAAMIYRRRSLQGYGNFCDGINQIWYCVLLLGRKVTDFSWMCCSRRLYFIFLQNRLQESLKLFTSVCTNAVFSSASLVSLFTPWLSYKGSMQNSEHMSCLLNMKVAELVVRS